FGWIDGMRRTIDAEGYAIRVTPRRKRSNWSAVNIRRVQELIAAGRVRPAGVAAFEKRDVELSNRYSFERDDARLPPEYEKELRANAKAWAFFQAQPPGYRRTASWWVISAKREETRRRRLATLIADSENGERI